MVPNPICFFFCVVEEGFAEFSEVWRLELVNIAVVIVVLETGRPVVVRIVAFDGLLFGNSLLIAFVSKSTNFINDVVETASIMNVADSEVIKAI